MKLIAVLAGSLVILGSNAQGAPMPLRWDPSSRTPASVAPLSKKDVIARLKTLQDKQIAGSTELDNAIRKQLNETFKFEIAGDDLAVAGHRTTLVTKKIDELNKRRTELNARREIVDRVIFQVDTKWDGKSAIKDFLATTFIEMASMDLSDARDNRLWKEFTFLSMVMREVPEKNEDVLALFEGYLNFSNVLEPKTPAEFMASRNYTNGLESAQARASERSSLGDGVEPVSPRPGTVNVITGSLAGDTQQVPPPPAEVSSASSDETVSGTTSAAAAPAKTRASAPAPTATPIAKSKTETAEKAQLDSGQVPMSKVEPAGKAGSPDAAPLTTGAATRASTSTKETAQSAENLRVYNESKPSPTPTK